MEKKRNEVLKKGSEKLLQLNDFEKRKNENKQFSKREELFFQKRSSNSRERERNILTAFFLKK